MTDLIPFDSGTLPAHVMAQSANSDLTANVGGGGFPALSIKGKVFHIVREGVRELVANDEGDPRAALEVVVLRANSNLSKVFYKKAYDEDDSEGVAPDCYSGDGIKPSANVDKPVCETCDVCPNNEWGSKITDNGKKTKACQDSRRLAVSAPDQLNDPMLLRVPPASLKALGEFGATLDKRNVAYTAVVTRISFDHTQATPKLIFKPVAFLDEAQAAETLKLRDSEVVEQIIGIRDFVAADKDKDDEDKPAIKQEAAPDADVEKKAKAAAKRKKVAAAKKAAAKLLAEAEAEDDDDTDATTPVTTGSGDDALDDELDGLLDGLDDD